MKILRVFIQLLEEVRDWFIKPVLDQIKREAHTMAKTQQEVLEEVSKLTGSFQTVATKVQALIQEVKDLRTAGSDETVVYDKLVALEAPLQAVIDAADAVDAPAAPEAPAS